MGLSRVALAAHGDAPPQYVASESGVVHRVVADRTVCGWLWNAGPARRPGRQREQADGALQEVRQEPSTRGDCPCAVGGEAPSGVRGPVCPRPPPATGPCAESGPVRPGPVCPLAGGGVRDRSAWARVP